MKENSSKGSASRIKYYLMLIFVAFLWGFDPIVNSIQYSNYSAAALSALATSLSALMFFLMSVKKLKLLDKRYLKVALPISILNSVACLLQKIGLQYTTPARYAFLDHLACIVVPVMMLLFIKIKPKKLQWAASIICITGCLILTGVFTETASVGIGEILCGAAGLTFGICIAATGTYTKGMDISLFMMIHMTVYFFTSVVMAVALNFITVNGEPMERFVFSLQPEHILVGALFGFLTIGIGWLAKTEATRHVDPSASAVIGPFSAVISAVVSVWMGMDKMSPSLAISTVMVISAAIMSGISDARTESVKKEKTPVPNEHTADG